MTNKEQIMIDGCNVSGCEYVCNTAFGKNGCKHPMMKNIYCSKNPNCYFKQLQRKTAECEQIKEKYEALKLENQEGYEIVAELKHECEELKERIKCNCFDPKSNNNRCISYNRIAEDYERDLKRLENKIAECEKYEGAFRRIEKQSKINCEEICGKSYEACYDKDCLAIQIRDIINKAKGR